MTNNEQLVRLGIFIATGYLCAGVVLAIFASLPLWILFFNSEVALASLVVSSTFIIGLIIGLLLLRPLIPKVGVKAVFEQDVLILMIGLLFMSLAMNQAMLIVGLLVSAVALSWYFTANFKVQVKAASKGAVSALSLVGWAIGPLVVVLCLHYFNQYGLLSLRLLYAHFIMIAFWVWVQRLSLHTDYHDAPSMVLKLQSPDFALKKSSDKKFFDAGASASEEFLKRSTLKQSQSTLPTDKSSVDKRI